MGRPTKYQSVYCNLILDYFRVEHTVQKEIKRTNRKGQTRVEYREVANQLPTIAGFCAEVGISKQTLHNWVKRYEEFEEAYNLAKCCYNAFVIDLGARGFLNSKYAIFLSQNTMGWKH